MPRSREIPASYDDVLRATVVEPDGSFRPSRAEEELSHHRYGESTEHRPHVLSWIERDVLAQVRSVIAGDPALDTAGVEVEIDGRVIILAGTVPGPSTRVRVAQLACSVDGVDRVDNQLVCRSRSR